VRPNSELNMILYMSDGDMSSDACKWSFNGLVSRHHTPRSEINVYPYTDFPC
jgi:hypothetical protein